MLKKNPIILEYGKKLDFSDLYEDKVLMFERKYYLFLFLIFGVVLPTVIPVYCWNEYVLTAFCSCVVFKVTIILHHFFTVNSLAHFFGNRPYDFRIRPAENRLVCYLSLGEGNHNYHHVFPYDFRSSPFHGWEYFNMGTALLEIANKFGLVYDLKKATPAMINEAIEKKGIKEIALFDEKRNLAFRIAFGIFDNIFANIFIWWWIWPFIAYKYFMGLPMFIWTYDT